MLLLQGKKIMKIRFTLPDCPESQHWINLRSITQFATSILSSILRHQAECGSSSALTQFHTIGTWSFEATVQVGLQIKKLLASQLQNFQFPAESVMRRKWKTPSRRNTATYYVPNMSVTKGIHWDHLTTITTAMIGILIYSWAPYTVKHHRNLTNLY